MFAHRSCMPRGAKDTPVSQFDSGDRIATVVYSHSARHWPRDEFAAENEAQEKIRILENQRVRHPEASSRLMCRPPGREC